MIEPKEFEIQYLEDQFDTVDSSFFTGDGIFTKEAIERAQWYLDRWNRRLVEIEAIVKDVTNDN